MKTLPAPEVLLRKWLQSPHVITAGALAIACVFAGIAAWLILRNLRHNEPGLRKPMVLPFALIISAAGIFGASRLSSPWGIVVGAAFCVLSAILSAAARRQFSRNTPGPAFRLATPSYPRSRSLPCSGPRDGSPSKHLSNA